MRILDLPYWHGPTELVHLLSVISPIADDLAVVYLPLLPVGLWALLVDLGIRLIEVPDDEFEDGDRMVIQVAIDAHHGDLVLPIVVYNVADRTG